MEVALDFPGVCGGRADPPSGRVVVSMLETQVPNDCRKQLAERCRSDLAELRRIGCVDGRDLRRPYQRASREACKREIGYRNVTRSCSPRHRESMTAGRPRPAPTACTCSQHRYARHKSLRYDFDVHRRPPGRSVQGHRELGPRPADQSHLHRGAGQPEPLLLRVISFASGCVCTSDSSYHTPLMPFPRRTPCPATGERTATRCAAGRASGRCARKSALHRRRRAPARAR